ncbi:1-hydroxycarotenoid 3,4-desaturase CrtD [Sphingomicrobium sediminis]|uniref:1-hydroxycarotenoid 3,4-desaturase CrtD n=1 Tax=Sphingomicrobium sediminis TaxID=2950949 RepID=UPI0031342D65
MQDRVVVIGAGIGGLASAALLAARGMDVTLVEKEEMVGGKARRVEVDGRAIDAGPTVFTMREVFDDIFQACGAELDDFVSVRRADILARHAWSGDAHLDLHADPQRSEDAIGDFAGADAAKGYRAFSKHTREMYETLESTFLKAGHARTPLPLVWRIGPTRLRAQMSIRPFQKMWSALGRFFPDPRLRQLFGRYATYCGSSPFDAPATLMLIAHVEARGVWLIEGGMQALAEAMRNLAEGQGAKVRTGEAVARIEIAEGKASGVILESGERIAATQVVCNADPSAIGSGLFGEDAARAVPAVPPAKRSLSAYVWLAHAETSGFPLARHNVLFSPDYPAEFADISAGRTPQDPTAYVCAQNRDACDGAAPYSRERLQIIVNAPATGDRRAATPEEMDRCTSAMRRSLERCGLSLEQDMPHRLVTPDQWERLFPSTGGALYGRASHGWAASFRRQGPRTRIPGLYCAGGATHPGAGVPMAALSGQLAARTLMSDRASMSRSHPVATNGGMSMPSARTSATG